MADGFAVMLAPAPECVVERRVEALTFAETRASFADREADLMPDFEIPVPEPPSRARG